MPSACEVDVCGTVSMYALTLASGTPERAARLEQQLRRRPRQGGLLPLQQPAQGVLRRRSAMDYQEIIAGTVGRENTYGTIVGRVKAGPMTFARFSTDDRSGGIRGYVGEGRFTKDPLKTFGGAGVVEIANLQDAAALHLRERLRASRGGQSLRGRRRAARGDHPVPRVGHAAPRVARMAVVAGVDFGTQSVRVSIVDSVRGPVGTGVGEYPVIRDRADPDFATQSHAAHMDALVRRDAARARRGRRAGRATSCRSPSIPPARR